VSSVRRFAAFFALDFASPNDSEFLEYPSSHNARKKTDHVLADSSILCQLAEGSPASLNTESDNMTLLAFNAFAESMDLGKSLQMMALHPLA
jgi:hypothetical protein